MTDDIDSDSDCKIVEDDVFVARKPTVAPTTTYLDPDVQMELRAMMGTSSQQSGSSAGNSASTPHQRPKYGGILTAKTFSELRPSLSPAGKQQAAAGRPVLNKPKPIDQAAKQELVALMQKPAVTSEEK